MDKIATKKVLDAAGVPTAPWFVESDTRWTPAANAFELSFPCVVKAPRDGSSVGVYLVKRPEDYARAVSEARRIDREKFGGSGEALHLGQERVLREGVAGLVRVVLLLVPVPAAGRADLHDGQDLPAQHADRHLAAGQERLDREFNMNVITTVPNVSYHIFDKHGEMREVHNPAGMPDQTEIEHIEEPYIRASIITRTDYIGNIMTLCLGKRGELVKQEYVSGDRVELYYDMPLAEIVIDFYDKLKSISKGYASFDYHPIAFRPSKLVKLDILLNGEPVDALSTLTHVDNSVYFGRRMCEKLKELLPRQQFDIAIQAAIGAKIIARETIKAVRKDVTAKCYGGDISRKRKLLEKQKKGKKRMKQIGSVEVPQKAFLAVLKLD